MAYVLIALGFVTLGVIISFPNLRSQARQWFRGNDRKILATLRDDISRTGQWVSVFKVREGSTISLEFYTQIENPKAEGTSQDEGHQSSIELIQKIELPNSIDGYVTFMGEATNLAVANLDGDPQLEILVPTYSLDFAASLDVIKYNTGSNRFELMSSFDVPENLIQGFQREAK